MTVTEGSTEEVLVEQEKMSSVLNRATATSVGVGQWAGDGWKQEPGGKNLRNWSNKTKREDPKELLGDKDSR